MTELTDNKAIQSLLDAMQHLNEDLHKQRNQQNEKLWKVISDPESCQLSDILRGMTKSDMDTLRKNYDFKGISSLKKNELAETLSELIPVHFTKALNKLDQERYNLIKNIAHGSGTIEVGENVSHDSKSMIKIRRLMEQGLAFPAVYNEQRVLVMPSVLIHRFNEIDGIEFQERVRKNTEWIRITQGLLYYYGAMEITALFKKVKDILQDDIDVRDYLDVLSIASGFYGQVNFRGSVLKDYRVYDAKKIMDEQQKRATIDYYPFTKKQLFKAGDPGFIDKTVTMNQFLTFLSDNYDIGESELDVIAYQLTIMINKEAEPSMLIQYLQSQFDFPSYDFVQELSMNIMEVYNHTRQWILKGHAPNDLRSEGQSQRKAQPSTIQAKAPAKMGTAKTTSTKMTSTKTSSENDGAVKDNVIDMTTRKKVGRNDPCPCGSGKKYKKCCGR